MSSGLGRGLSSLISPQKPNDSNFDPSDNKNRILQIKVDLIQANVDQPRQDFNRDHLNELVESIKEHGILQPLIAMEKDGEFELIAGERRLKASRLAGLETVPVIIRSVDQQEKLELALIENLQRQDLSPMETALAYQKLILDFSLTQEKVAKKVGKSRSSVSNCLRLLNLPEEIKQALFSKRITEAHAKQILSLSEKKEQIALFKKIIQQGLSVKETSKASQNLNSIKTVMHKNYQDQEKEKALQRFFNSQVEIVRKRQGGKIVVEFYSNEDLDGIINKVI